MTQFETAVCAALSYDGDPFRPVEGSYSQNYRSESGETRQLIDPKEFRSYVRERYRENGNGEPNEDDYLREETESRQILVDFDQDEHGNRYSQFFYVIDL